MGVKDRIKKLELLPPVSGVEGMTDYQLATVIAVSTGYSPEEILFMPDSQILALTSGTNGH